MQISFLTSGVITQEIKSTSQFSEQEILTMLKECKAVTTTGIAEVGITGKIRLLPTLEVIGEVVAQDSDCSYSQFNEGDTIADDDYDSDDEDEF